MHFRAGPTTDRQAAPSDNRAQEATAARCRRAGAEGSGRDEPTAAAGIADRDPRAGLHSREEAFSSQQVMPSQTAAADFRASANQTKSAQAELADGSATCAQETGAAAAGEDLQDRDAAGEDEGPGAAGASAARGAGMCVAAPETLGHASAPSWRDDGAAGRGAGEEEEPGPACRHERRPPCAGTGSGHEGRVPEDGAPYGGEVGIAGRGARAPGALQRDLAAAQARTEPGGAVSAPGPGSVRTAGTQTEAESEGRAPGSSSLPGKELREVGSQTEPGGDSSAPLGREVCGTGTQTEAAGGVGGDSRLFSQAFPLPADPAQIAERIRRNRARMSVAFDDTEYEPYGLPEVVMKGFADIPSGPACPYVLRRGLLGSTALPPSLREEAGESPQDATD
ncbi:CENPF protein, partial [Atractosteus spatula]|nr:CENPF protein [Atractosteus spatula]